LLLAIGAAKPETWIEKKDPAGSSLTYWWNPETNQTTSLGAPKPNTYTPTLSIGRNNGYQPRSFGGVMMYSMALGFGMSMAFAFVRVILG